MILCLSTGNTNIFGGVFQNDNIVFSFRHATRTNYTSDQLGLFLKNILRENDIDPKQITKIAICSVVPSLDYSLRAAAIKYFHTEPFMLQYGMQTEIKVESANPEKIGADLLANAIAAITFHPDRNIIIASFGTATTVSAIRRDKVFLGGAIMPGFRIAMESLQNNAAKLAAVEIIKPNKAINLNTEESIQAGLYYGQLGAIREMIRLFTEEAMFDQKPLLIGTGGFSSLFQDNAMFDIIEPDLILHGIRLAVRHSGVQKNNPRNPGHRGC